MAMQEKMATSLRLLEGLLDARDTRLAEVEAAAAHAAEDVETADRQRRAALRRVAELDTVRACGERERR
jgi:hypothetical protein